MGRRKGSKNKVKLLKTIDNQSLSTNTNQMCKILPNDLNTIESYKSKNPFINKSEKTDDHNSMNNYFNLDTSFIVDTQNFKEVSDNVKEVLVDSANWENSNFVNDVETFKVMNPKENIKNEDDLSYLKYFFNNNLINFIYIQTNKSVKEEKNEKDYIEFITKKEIMTFIGITLYMGVFKLPNMKMYWTENAVVGSDMKSSLISNSMEYKRFTFIRSHFRITFYLNSNDDNNFKKCSRKTEFLIDEINKLLSSIYVPGREISIDESTIAFKGNCSALVYNPCKPDKWGLQFRVLTDSKTRYVYRLKFFDKEKHSISEVIKILTSGLEGCNYHLYVDNFYSSFTLARELLERKIYLTGTLRKRRGGPDMINLNNIKGVEKKTIIPFCKENVNCFVYFDSKPVVLISTFFNLTEDYYELNTQRVKIKDSYYNCVNNSLIPSFINSYNKFMGGVDVFDQEIKYYNPQRRTYRWTLKVSIYLIQTMLHNSYVLYKTNKSNLSEILTHMDYELTAIKCFLNWCNEVTTLNTSQVVGSTDGNECLQPQATNQSTNSANNQNKIMDKKYGGMNNSHIHIPSDLTKRARCHLCYSEGKDNRTKFFCTVCNVALCFNGSRKCWFYFHILQSEESNE